mgnify:CR=1 FL=1
MTTEKIAQRDFISLEKDLALIYANDLQYIKVAENAIEALLSEARRLLATTENRGLSFAHVLENLLLLIPDADLSAHLGYEAEIGLSQQWSGSLLGFDGDPEIFHELYSAVMHLRASEDSHSRSRHGAKGGATQRKSEVKEDIVNWWNEIGRKTRTNKSGAIDWLIGNWTAFCDEYGIISDTPAPHKKTIYKYLQGLRHKSDKNSRAKPAS